MEDPEANANMDWSGKPSYPSPDYLSSSRKRLAPQLIYKGGIIHIWRKKIAVALNTGFCNTLPKLEEVEPADAEVAWMVYDLRLAAEEKRYRLEKTKTVYTKFNVALDKITRSEPGDMASFVEVLQTKLDEKLDDDSAPETSTLDVLLYPMHKRKIINVASVPQRSPFRYPGGKTWLVPYIRTWLKSLPSKPKNFVEPFAGGGIVSLTVAFESLAENVVMVELDDDVAAVWKAILGKDAEWLARKIVSFDVTVGSVKEELAKHPQDLRQKAFQTILSNRVHHGGIMARGSSFIKFGENGKGINSRWYPSTLRKRILDIAGIGDRLQFIEGDGMLVIAQYLEEAGVVYFIDPPYTAAGKRAGTRLYKHNELDHAKLFDLMGKVKGEYLMTYDNADSVLDMAKTHGFDTELIAMKNTHHTEMTELLIGRSLQWVRKAEQPKQGMLPFDDPE